MLSISNYKKTIKKIVDVAELVDALDLGPSNFVVRVRVSPSTFNLLITEIKPSTLSIVQSISSCLQQFN